MHILAQGDVIGDLRIESEIGSGAFGRVYLARDTLLERRVALKVIPAQQDQLGSPEARRILLEARAAGKIHSPHVVALHRVHPPGEHAAWMFEMEFVEGGSLSDFLQEDQRLAPERALAIAKDIARALQAAHRSGVVHGDLKPGNILMTPDGQARLGDFGLAHVNGDASISATGAGILAGTPAYMAPERIMGDPPASEGDLWGLGVLLFRMLSGRVPFATRDIFALFNEIQNAAPPPLPSQVPDALSSIVLALLDKNPSARPPLDAVLALTPESAPVTVAPDRAPRKPTPGEAPLRGRAPELRRIESWLDAAVVDHRGASALVSGEAGVGKTALVRSAERLARERGMHALEVRLSPLEGLFVPLVRALRTTLDTEGKSLFASEPFGSAANVVRDLLQGEDAQTWETIESARWAVERSLLGLVQERGALLVIEDAQDANAHDVQLLRHLLRHLPPQGLLVLMTARSPHSDAGESVSQGNLALAPLAADPSVQHIALQPLDREQTFALLEDARPGLRWSADVTQRLLDLGGGNPLYTIEGLRHLEATGAVHEAEGLVCPGPRWREESLPEALRGLVATRIGTLSEEEHELLDVAAADGVEFDAGALSAVLGKSVLKVLRGLQRIYRERGVILPTREGFRFANALSHEALYVELAPALRRELHRMLAEHLEQARVEREISPARLALHWERAGQLDKARPHARVAALDCLNRHEIQRGLEWAERGGVTADAPDELLLAQADLVISLTVFFREANRPDRSALLLDRLQAAADSAGATQISLICAMARNRYRIQDEGVASADADELERIAQAMDPNQYRARTYSILANVLRARSRFDEALVALDEAERLWKQLDSTAGLASCLATRGGIHLAHAEYEEAARFYADAARTAQKKGERLNAAIHQVNRAVALERLGKVEEAIPLLEHSIRTFDLEGAEVKAAGARGMAGSSLMAVGRIRKAKELAEEAIAIFERTGNHERALDARNDVLITYLLLGELDAVAANIEEVEELARRRGIVQPISACLLTRMDLHLFGGDVDRACFAASSAIDHGIRKGRVKTLIEAVEYIAMQVVMGLPARILPELRRAASSKPLAESGPGQVGCILMSAAEAWVDPEPGHEFALLETAQALRQAEAVRGNQELLLTADLLEVEGLLRQGRREEATRIARRAATAARAQERVWHLLSFLHRIGDEAAHEEAVRLLEKLASARADPDDRRRLIDAWSP